MRKHIDMLINPVDEEEAEKIISTYINTFNVNKIGICVNNIRKIPKKYYDKVIISYVVKANTKKELEKGVKDAKNHLSKFKIPSFVILTSTSYDVLRYGVEKRKVDALLDLPLSFEMFKIDEVLIGLCSQNNISLMFNFNTFRRSDRNKKVKYLRNLRKILQIAYKKNVISMPVSGAQTFYEICNPRELSSFMFIAYRNLQYALASTSFHAEEFWDFITKLNDKTRPVAGMYIGDIDA